MNEWQQPTSDEKLLAGLSHLLGFWIALIIWVFQRDSRYVRFQAMQSIAFSVLLWALGLVVGLVFSFLFFFIAIVMGAIIAAAVETGDPSGWITIPILLPAFAALIFIPLGLIAWVPRLIATVQTIQGKDFRYPWLSGLVERFLAN